LLTSVKKLLVNTEKRKRKWNLFLSNILLESKQYLKNLKDWNRFKNLQSNLSFIGILNSFIF
jgi:hypothetical protein